MYRFGLEPIDRLHINSSEARLGFLQEAFAYLSEITEERRKQLVKKVHSLAEDSRTAARQVRREANEEVKKLDEAARGFLGILDHQTCPGGVRDTP